MGWGGGGGGKVISRQATINIGEGLGVGGGGSRGVRGVWDGGWGGERSLADRPQST